MPNCKPAFSSTTLLMTHARWVSNLHTASGYTSTSGSFCVAASKTCKVSGDSSVVHDSDCLLCCTVCALIIVNIWLVLGCQSFRMVRRQHTTSLHWLCRLCVTASAVLRKQHVWVCCRLLTRPVMTRPRSSLRQLVPPGPCTTGNPCRGFQRRPVETENCNIVDHAHACA